MQYNKAFYEKHGIKVTDDPINYNKTAEQTQLENSLREFTMGNSVTLHTVKLIEQAIDKYPDSEALKNYLYAAYIKTGQPDKGLACLNNTLQQHPDYAFGVINLANYYLQKGELDKAAEFLTKPYDVYRIEKEEYIHDSVFISYYQAVVRLALANYDMKTAQKYHRMMFDYDPTNKTVKEISGEILQGRFSSIAKRMVAPQYET